VLLLESGRALLKRVERDGAEVALALSAPGAFLGLASAVRRAPHATSAVARADSVVVAIAQDRVHEALASPQLAPAIVEQLALEHVTLIERYTARAALSVRDRVLALLREMTPADAVLPWPVHLSTTDLANPAGADGSSVCRILRALRDDGVVTYKRGRIALLVR
jgi:CRP-like cAMP-binding protein